MNPLRKQALDLIEQNVHRLSRADRGRQLLMVTEDYIQDQDLLEARRVLQSIDRLYFTDDLPQQAIEEPDVARSLVTCIEAFGLELERLRKPQGSA